jgi:hypothetical protein
MCIQVLIQSGTLEVVVMLQASTCTSSAGQRRFTQHARASPRYSIQGCGIQYLLLYAAQDVAHCGLQRKQTRQEAHLLFRPSHLATSIAAGQ